MPLYMYQLSYTPEAVAALVREPQDRIEAVRPAIEALGGKLVHRLPVRRVRRGCPIRGAG